jgi:hypothetical protein
MATLLIPKAATLAFAIFPRTGEQAAGSLFLVLAIVATASSTLWIAVGRAAAGSAGRAATEAPVARIAAVVIGRFATFMAGSAVAAVVA